MAHPNVDLLQGFLDAYGANDRDAVGTSLSEDAVWHVGGTHRFSGDYRGRDAILEYFDRVGSETSGTLRLEPIELMANEDRGAAFLHVTGEREGNRLDVTMAEAFQFDGEGRIREFWAHATDQKAIDEFWA
jgi:uncharacterized protein